MKPKKVHEKHDDDDQDVDEKKAAESKPSISDNMEDVCSRLIAKNLPGTGKKKWDEQRIRNYFGKFGKITDVKLKLNEKTGACRFAFIGYEDPKCCQMAIEKLNGSFLHGTKLQIEECKPLTDERKDITNKFTLQKLKQKVETQQCLSDEKDDLNVNELQQKMILDTGRLFVRNLPFSCSESNLSELFSPFGPIAELECIINRAGECKGFALCTFMFPEHALEAWKKLDGKIFMGRMLHIIAGEEKKKSGANQPEGKALSNFQRDREVNRKENAGKTAHTWNALFLGSNAVAETLAESYEVEKRHLLLDEGENSTAVRMAMAETNLVRETRKFLIENGIKLDAFSKANAKRSKTVILVKNLSGRPGEQAQLKKLFSQYGDLKSIIMPPVHGISALVEMGNELDAKKAFEGLAYAKKLQNGQPIYLEWAPMDVFDENRSKKPAKTKEDEGKNNEIIPKEDVNNEDKKEENDEKQPEVTKILVRNVPFQANIKEISQLFSAFGELKFIRMPKKVGSEGHRGFCFVDFISIGDAKRAMDSLAHSTHLYGRRLVLEWAKQEETIDELRNKTKRKMHPGKEAKKRTKMRSFAPAD